MRARIAAIVVSASLSCGGETTAANDASGPDSLAPTTDTGAVDTSGLDSNTDHSDLDGSCSDARWPLDTVFAYEHGGPTHAHPCTPHCGANRPASSMWPGDHLTSQALPFGACSAEGDVCTLDVEWVGPCPDEGTARGPLDLFLCRCRGGSWACTVDDASPSATAQSCDAPSH